MTTYDVFLSHASTDKPAVEALARKLRDEEELGVFFDEWELVPGTQWQEALEKALAASRTCAVFLGPKGLGPWHTQEMRVALGQRVRREPKRVIPVLLPGARQRDVPDFLAQRTWVDFRTDLDGNFNRLVAGIRGAAPGDGGLSPAEPYRSMAPPSDQFVHHAVPAASPEALGRRLTPAGQGGRRPAIVALLVTAILTVLLVLGKLWPGDSPGSVERELRSYQITVLVVDEDGDLVDDAELKTSQGEILRTPRAWEVRIADATTTALRLEAARPSAFLEGCLEVELGDDPKPTFKVKLERKEVEVRGRVFDAEYRPVSGARVHVVNHPDEAVLTDEDGYFKLPAHAADGQYLVLEARKGDLYTGPTPGRAGKHSHDLVLNGQ